MFNKRIKANSDKALKANINNYKLRTSNSFMLKSLNKIALNKPLQIFMVVVSFVLVLLYLYLGVRDISALYYDVSRNTEVFKSEVHLDKIQDLEVKDSGVTVIVTTKGKEYKQQKVGYVFVDPSVIDADTRYYVASDNLVISAVGSDFVSNYIIGSKFIFVFFYVVLFEFIRYSLESASSSVMKKWYVKTTSRVCIALYILFLVTLLMLFT